MKRIETLFYVIYSFDIKWEDSVASYKPPYIKKWLCTEGDEEAEDWESDEKYKQKYKHRKYTALLTRKQFDTFVHDQWLIADEIETMGSLTIEFGLMSAISFNYEGSECAYKNAYVTPMPVHPKDKTFFDPKTELAAQRGWDRMKRAVLSTWGM